MTANKRANSALEWGDFQTPPALCRRVAEVLASIGFAPATVVEPTCGVGGLLCATLSQFPGAVGWGVEIDPEKCGVAESNLADCRHRVERRDFYRVDWDAELGALPAPRLVVGNPPWVTSAELGKAGVSRNLPSKSIASAAQPLRGLDAITGAANFDVSEFMLCRLLLALRDPGDGLAMLVKTSVARRVLCFAWDQKLPGRGACYAFDARREFGVAVDATLLVWRYVAEPGVPEGEDPAQCDTAESSAPEEESANLFHLADPGTLQSVFGRRDGLLVSDLAAFERHRNFWRSESPHSTSLHTNTVAPSREYDYETFRWRSGVKHDCSRVFELHGNGTTLHNGKDDAIDLEREWVYPLCKGSALHRGDAVGSRWIVMPQRRVGEDTGVLQQRAPKVWSYLQSHAEALSARRSSIYRSRPPFSIFGVGDYSFRPWKVAISGLHKSLRFRLLGPHEGQPVLFDDTVYFLGFDDGEVARRVWRGLLSEEVQQFLRSVVFWDTKRPITAKLLGQLDLGQVCAVDSSRAPH